MGFERGDRDGHPRARRQGSEHPVVEFVLVGSAPGLPTLRSSPTGRHRRARWPSAASSRARTASAARRRSTLFGRGAPGMVVVIRPSTRSWSSAFLDGAGGNAPGLLWWRAEPCPHRAPGTCRRHDRCPPGDRRSLPPAVASARGASPAALLRRGRRGVELRPGGSPAADRRPSLSQQIKALERDLGVALFERDRRCGADRGQASRCCRTCGPCWTGPMTSRSGRGRLSGSQTEGASATSTGCHPISPPPVPRGWQECTWTRGSRRPTLWRQGSRRAASRSRRVPGAPKTWNGSAWWRAWSAPTGSFRRVPGARSGPVSAGHCRPAGRRRPLSWSSWNDYAQGTLPGQRALVSGSRRR